MVTENEIEIRISNDRCDECDDEPRIIQGWYNGEMIYSECLHESNDLENVIDDVIASSVDIIEEEETKKSIRHE